MAECNISRELRLELDFLTYLFGDAKRRFWKTPIAQSVPRTAHFHGYSDASLKGLGAACEALRFMFSIKVRQDVHQLTKSFVERGPELITINELELAAAILLFAGFGLLSFKAVMRIAQPGRFCKFGLIISPPKSFSIKARQTHRGHVRFYEYWPY